MYFSSKPLFRIESSLKPVTCCGKDEMVLESKIFSCNHRCRNRGAQRARAPPHFFTNLYIKCLFSASNVPCFAYEGATECMCLPHFLNTSYVLKCQKIYNRTFQKYGGNFFVIVFPLRFYSPKLCDVNVFCECKYQARKWRICPMGQNLPVQSIFRGKSYIFLCKISSVMILFGGPKSWKIFH